MNNNAHKTVMTFAVAALAMLAVSCAFVAFSDDDADVDALSFRLTFNANGGSGAPGALSGSVDDDYYTFTIPMTEPTRSGYLFMGWSYDSDNSYVDYLPGDEIEVYDDETPLTMYAVWGYPITFTYHAPGASSVPAPSQNCVS